MTDNDSEPMVEEINLTNARNLSPLFDKAVRQANPVIIVRGGKERGLLVARDTVVRLLAKYELHVDVIPEEEGGFTLWLRELELGAHGPALPEARRAIFASIRSYVRNYLEEFDFYRHLPEMIAQEPYVYRLALAQNDAELATILFGAGADADAAA